MLPHSTDPLMAKPEWPDLKVDFRPMDELPGAGARLKTPMFVREG